MEVAPVQEVPRTKEGGPELSICKHSLRNRLRDRTLPRPGQPVQPVDRRFVKISRPELNLIQDSSAGSLQTTPTVTMPVSGRPRAAEIIEDGCFSCWRLVSDDHRWEWKAF